MEKAGGDTQAKAPAQQRHRSLKQQSVFVERQVVWLGGDPSCVFQT